MTMIQFHCERCGEDLTGNESRTHMCDPARLNHGAVKYDAGKTDWTLIPWKGLHAIVEVLQFGAKKYARDAWQHVPNARQRYAAALMRHVIDYVNGHELDAESKLPTLAHAGCCVLFLLALPKDTP